MKKTCLFLCMCFLSGCTLFGTEETRPLYTLKSGNNRPADVLKTSLAIDIPTCEASLDTSLIAITPSPYQRSYLADGQWPDNLSKVLQQTFIETYSQRWGGKYIAQVGAGLQTTYVLQPDVQDFSVYHLDKPHPEVRLKILLKLVDLQSRTVVDAYQFCETAPASSVTMRSIVEAFNKALHCFLAKSIPWIEKTVTHHPPQSLEKLEMR